MGVRPFVAVSAIWSQFVTTYRAGVWMWSQFVTSSRRIRPARVDRATRLQPWFGSEVRPTRTPLQDVGTRVDPPPLEGYGVARIAMRLQRRILCLREFSP